MINPFKGLLQQIKSSNQLTVAAYRFVTLAIAAILIIISSPDSYFKINPFVLLGVACAEALIMLITHLFFVNKVYHIATISSLGLEVVFCILVIVYSGATSSPFILYSLSPVLTAALILNKRSTAILAVLLVSGLFISHIFNPFYNFMINALTVSTQCIYVVATGLVGALPFLINVNLKQRLEDTQARQERLRLSREIHDGVAQTLIALSWQFQQVRRNLAQNNADSDELQKLEKLAAQATRDIRESIEVLRHYESKGNFVSLLRESLENLKKDSNIDFELNVSTDNIRLENNIEAETMRVIQEALINIKKHSGATRVRVNLNKTNGYVLADIIDNGRGFEYSAQKTDKPRLKGHYGLSVMRERMHSINGDLLISSNPGQGTEIHIKIPCKMKGE